MNPVSENSVTIMKYKSPDGVYDFKCLDKWNVVDEVERLGKMIEEKKKLEAEGYEVLWIKTLPIFDLQQRHLDSTADGGKALDLNSSL